MQPLETHSAILLSDSEVRSLRHDEGNLLIDFSDLYILRSNGIPGQDPGTIWIQEAELWLLGVQLSGQSPPLPYEIYDGKLKLGKDIYSNMIPVALDYAGDVALDLIFGDGSTIHATAKEIRLKLIGSPEFIDTNIPKEKDQ